MKAALLMAYGTPRSTDEVEAYYTHIRGGRGPTPTELDNLVERYKAIGGMSPLVDITERERAALESGLKSRGSDTKVYSAMKHAPPFIPDVVTKIADDGVTELLALALAPHYSKMSIGAYMSSVLKANDKLANKMKVTVVDSWHDNPELINIWKNRIEDASSKIGNGYSLVFSAHSLPERILAEGDPYKHQLMRTCTLVSDAIGRDQWTFTFQSAGHTSEPWLRPDILEHLASLRQKGERTFVVAPIGFVSDHLEILYDIDVECARWAEESGSTLLRCRSLNDSPEFIRCLSSIVREKGFF